MKLVQRMSQRVVMTPLLQQAIQLLQLSTLELEQVVRKELEENPLLEEVPVENPDSPEAAATPGTTAEAPAAPEAPPATEPVSKETSSVDGEKADDLPFDLSSAIFDDHGDERTPVSMEERDELPFENLGRSDTSLGEHLMEQLRLGTDDKDLLRIGEAIIGNLDEDGYLRADVGEIAAGMGASPEAVECALKLIHGFDPPGVAARSVQECLLLQLTADAEPDPISVEIVERHFEDLERRRYAEIARALKQPLERVMESIEEIQSLEPKPGRRFSANDSRYVVPDVTIQKVGEDYVVILNEEGIPRLRVNSLYRSLLRRSGDEAKQYVEQKLRSAVWLIKSVEQRQRTLRKVAQSLVNFQRDFLDKGLPFLRPLALRDVGDDISMHESTISRVTTNKYVQTPQGLFELKFFFHSGIASENGSMVSSVSVKKTIRDMVAGEDGGKPLSDQEIAQSLQGQGLTIARRTVAKYREELGILPSHQRRQQSKKR
ncbi:MAG TPA: RNA polymerase factor sigma-54 [Candidatus Deferrimicrobiaceae bacterium]|nr:RNA polymerase factor sigma-54 [Candidatus Deferrimicrobiaceae bacterium]